MTCFKTKAVGLGIISYVGVDGFNQVKMYFEDAADHEMWEIREIAFMYIRKITVKNPTEVQMFLLKLAKDRAPNKRRFVSECLRPVAENKWINKVPEFSLTILRCLF